jgi:hypothetical protein
MAVTTVKGHFDAEADGMIPYYSLHHIIRDAAVATGDWELLIPAGETFRYMLKGKGYSGEEEIFIGFDRYNNFEIYDTGTIRVCGFTGFVPENTFVEQPGYKMTEFRTVSDKLDYWINISPQRICGCTRQKDGIWQSFYAGFLNRYGFREQLPYPLVIAAGNVSSTNNLDYTWSTATVPYMSGNTTQLYFRDNVDWRTPYIWPYSNAAMSGTYDSNRPRPGNTKTGGVFPLLPLIVQDANGLYGELEGVYAGPAWDAELGDIIQVNDIDHILIGNIVTRERGTIALRMD